MSQEEMKELLFKPLWNLQDIQNYFGVGKTKASQMMQESKKISVNRFMPSRAKREALFEINDLDFQEELNKAYMIESLNG